MPEATKSAVTVIFAACAVTLGMKIFFAPLAPFIFGFAVAFLSVKSAEKLGFHRSTAKKRISAFISVLIYAILIGIIALAGRMIYKQLSEMYYALRRDEGKISALLGKLKLLPDFISEKIFHGDDDETGEIILTLVKKLTDSVFSAVSSLLGKIAAEVPSILLFFFAAIFSGIMFCFGFDEISGLVKKYIPTGKIKTSAARAVWKTFCSEALIAFFMFSLLYLGFSVLGVRYSLALSVITAMLDALPAIGTGIVLAPYATISFLSGERKAALFLIILWGITALARQVLEPKLIGEGAGIPPVLSLFAMYAGIKLFGGVGAVFSPLAVSVIATVIKDKKEMTSL